MRTALLLTALMSGSLLNFSAGAVDQSAPFGFSWGPVDKVPSTSDEVKELKAEARQLKETLAEVLIENRLLKKSVLGDGEDAS